MEQKFLKVIKEAEKFPPFIKNINSENTISFNPLSLNSISTKHQTSSFFVKIPYKPIVIL